jgi:hypothetical protein
MAISLTFTRGDYVPPVNAVAAVEAVASVPATPDSDEIPAVEAVEAVEAQPGGWHIRAYSLSTGTASMSGSLWLEGIAENASDEEIGAAIKALYGLSD